MSGDTDDLVRRALTGEHRAVGRLISMVEDAAPSLPQVMARLASTPGEAAILGLTGPPGVGKSTTVAALVGAYREERHRVGVLAVDPSSPFSGGALLGDRVRMQGHATDPEVYIRSMSSRGHLGGLARAAPQAIRVLSAAGCGVVLVETVGVGQSEVEVAGLADTTVILLAPGMGDAVQAAKAGLLEVGDIYVVNKADREGAKTTVSDLRAMLRLGERRAAGDYRPPVIAMVAERGEGIGELKEAVAAHRRWLKESGTDVVRRRHRVSSEVTALARATLLGRLTAATDARAGREVIDALLAGTTDPYAAAAELVRQVDLC